MMLNQHLISPGKGRRFPVALLRSRQVPRSRSRGLAESDDYLAKASHDIRLPVGNIVGMADLLLQTELSDEQREYLDMLKVSADTTLNLVNGLLDLKRLEAGGLLLEQVPFDLRQVADNAMRLLRTHAAAKGIGLHCVIDSSLPAELLGDPLRLGQIVTNLLENAIKFTTEGQVVLRIRRLSGEFSRVRLHFSVADSGIGIPLERQQRIFAPFVQAGVSTARKYGGSGLGLAIVAGLVGRMGGAIQLESEPGFGSVFQFALDFACPSPRLDSLPSGRGLQVLIADDDAISCELARHILQRNGHTVRCVSNGVEAISAVRNVSFDLLLMDLHMPLLGGLAAARLIRASAGDGAKNLPIVALSASDDETRHCLMAGMDYCLTKPLTAAALSRLIGPGSKPLPVINLSALHERANGDQSLLAEIAGIFTRRTPSLLAALRADLRRGDKQALARNMHTLQGMLKNLSAEAACLAADEFARMVAGDLPGSRQALSNLSTEIASLGISLNQLINASEAL